MNEDPVKVYKRRIVFFVIIFVSYKHKNSNIAKAIHELLGKKLNIWPGVQKSI